MARQRFIHPDFWTDPTIAKLKPDERLLFIGCFSNADDEGRLLGDPAFLRSTVFPYDDISLLDMKALRDRVVSVCSNLVLYSIDGVDYLAFTKWKRYQSPRYPKPSKLPPPPSNDTPPPEQSCDDTEAGVQPNSCKPDAGLHHRVGLGRDGLGSSSGSGDDAATTDATTATTTTDSGFAALVSFWQNNGFGPMVPLTADKLYAYLEDGMQADLVQWAMEQAVIAGVEKLNFAYVDKILRRLQTEGIKTREQAEAQYRARSARSAQSRDSPVERIVPLEEARRIQAQARSKL